MHLLLNFTFKFYDTVTTENHGYFSYSQKPCLTYNFIAIIKYNEFQNWNIIEIFLDINIYFRYKLIRDKHSLSYGSLNFRKKQWVLLEVESIKAVSPTGSGIYKSGESYRKWNYSGAALKRSLKFCAEITGIII